VAGPAATAMRGAKPNCPVMWRGIHTEFYDVHARQYRLTSSSVNLN
jgi:hypothetical protein